MNRSWNRIWMGALLLVLASCLLLPTASFAQAAGGALEGRVFDADGAALPGATVTVTNADTGFSRVTVTASDGAFRFPALPIGTYNVQVELEGFSSFTQSGVHINVATTRSLEINLKLASVEETITVTGETPLINSSPAIGTVVSQQELENLPLNGRQFANLAVLAPGTSLAYNTDPTKPGQLVVALNGGIGRNVNYVMDGGDNTDDTIGGALQNFNLESVQEFKIQTMQYKAEFGRSSGGVLSVVTKSGTNDFRGSAYGYFRNDSYASRTESEKLAGIDKQKLDRKQYGASLGGPIVRDRAHFFATYEKTDRSTNYTVNTGGNFPSFDGQTVELPFTDELITAKASVDVNAKQYLQVRYGYQKNDDKYGASPLAAPSSLGTIGNEYGSILASHTAQIGTDKVNEFLVQWSKFDNAITADSSDPLIYYPSGFHTGQNLNTPQTTSQRKHQFKDDFSWSTTLGGRRHDFKFGAGYIDEPTLGGDFSTGLAGQYTATEDRIGSPISLIQVFGGFFGESTPIKQYSYYAQDDIYITDNLTVNLGIRYDLWKGFDLDQRNNAIWQVFSTQTTYNEPYLRDFQGGKGGVLKDDTNNYGPRLGFTWDVKGDGRHLLRGGYGTFFDFPYTNATILFPAAAVQSNYGLAYQFAGPGTGILNPNGTYFQPGDPLPPNQLPPGLGFVADEVASPTLATPYSDQISLGYSWQVNDWLGLNFEGVSIQYHNIPYRFRPNVIDPATGQLRFPQFGLFRLWYGNGLAKYDGVNIGFRVRQDRFELQGFYTYSEATGNVLAGADEFRLTDANAQADVGGTRLRRDQSINPLDPQCSACFGPLYTDAKNRLTFGGLYRAPYGITLSAMFRYHSPFPYLEHANTDLNGDGTILDLRPGVSHVNSGRGASFSQLDVRVSKDFIFGSGYGVEVLAEVFNLLNEKNAARPDRFGNPSAYAGDPGQGEQRLAQLGVRFHF
jgi:Carboxypeptidase regulatory-like domain/TonB dependent receptor-like, beta-barrel